MQEDRERGKSELRLVMCSVADRNFCFIFFSRFISFQCLTCECQRKAKLFYPKTIHQFTYDEKNSLSAKKNHIIIYYTSQNMRRVCQATRIRRRNSTVKVLDAKANSNEVKKQKRRRKNYYFAIVISYLLQVENGSNSISNAQFRFCQRLTSTYFTLHLRFWRCSMFFCFRSYNFFFILFISHFQNRSTKKETKCI